MSTAGRRAPRRLEDKSQYPDDAVLESALGRRFGAWSDFAGMVAASPSLSAEWRYYTDGKSWLHKVSQGKKTVCWASIRDGRFAVTFYFSARHDAALAAADIDAEIKQRYLHAERPGRISPLTVEVRRKDQLKDVRRLIELKRVLG